MSCGALVTQNALHKHMFVQCIPYTEHKHYMFMPWWAEPRGILSVLFIRSFFLLKLFVKIYLHFRIMFTLYDLTLSSLIVMMMTAMERKMFRDIL